MESEILKCKICPRRCGIDRAKTRPFCGAEDPPRVSRIMPHYWEEPFLSGTRGSGAVFFSGCNLGCAYCQNDAIRRGGVGEPMDASALASAYLGLQDQGVHNINLVTAAPHATIVIESLKLAKKGGLAIPVVYNSSGYELPETLHLFDGLIDIYLPDFKYVSPALSARFSAAPDYAEFALPAILEMQAQVGQLLFDADGIARRGLAIRHLVLPACADDSRRVLDAIASNLPLSTQLSIMSQYTPQAHTTAFPLNRRITAREYERVVSYALDLGFHNILTQELDSAQSVYTPTFTEQQ